MKLSIVTINYNNAEGLRKTMESVLAQTYTEIEYIIVDGASTDGSVDVIRELATRPTIKWVSEKDTGIYNAMNKGIRMATGEYCQFLNSGDLLLNPHLTQQMIEHLDQINAQREEPIGVMYGNMKKVMPDGKILHDACNGGHDVTLNMFYRGCLNHSPAYILRALFDKYGMYDESLRICSDWKFYLQSLVLGDESVAYVNVDVTLFDMTGISETNKDLLNKERNQLLNELIPQGILKDYHAYHFPMDQYRRLKRRHLWGLVHFVERVVFKLEKWHILR
jgi:glycosyltransferase involved in cell wall biosynthesis